MPEIGREAMIRNPRLEPLEPFIGVWSTVGHHSMIPGVTLHGRTSFEWHDGGSFVCVRTEIDEPRMPSAIAFIGSDDDSESWTMSYFDERKVSRRYEAAMDGTILRWWRMAPGFSQRYALTPSADGNTLHGVSGLSKDGMTWEQDLALHYTRER